MVTTSLQTLPRFKKTVTIKKTIVSFFLSKINIDAFSRLIKNHKLLLGIPFKFFAQRLIDFDFPTHIFIETTSICNLKCKMCPRNLSQISHGVMDFGLFKKIIDEAKQYDKKTFSLHLFGEPLLDPKFAERAEYIKKANPKNSIILTTNGTLLTDNIAKELTKYVDKLAVSIHSPNPSTYEKITGVNQLETVEKNIKGLIELKKETKSKIPVIYLRVIRVKENAEEINEFRRKWNRFPVKIEIRDEHNYGGKIVQHHFKKTPERYPCYHLWLAPGINWDGEVVICCDDVDRKTVLGNVKNTSLHEIWAGEALKKYRQYHLNGEYEKIPICKNCDVWDIYPDIFFERQKK